MFTLKNQTLAQTFCNLSNGLINEFSTFAALLVTFLVNLLIFKSYWSANNKRLPPGPWGLPIFGHLPFFGQSPPKTFARWRSTYGNVFRIRLGSWKTVILNGYDVIKEAADKGDDFSGRPGFVAQNITAAVRGAQSFAFGTFSEEYLCTRKMTTNALRMFTTNEKTGTQNLFIEEANTLAHMLVQKGVHHQAISILGDIQYAVGSTIFQFLYGHENQINIKEELRKMIDRANNFIDFTGNGNPFDVMPWLQYVMPGRINEFKRLLDENTAIGKRQVNEHVATFSGNNIRDMTDALLVADIGENNHKGQKITRSRLLATLTDLQGAGFDTTNKTLQWLILYMAAYPRFQRRVQKEIDDVIGIVSLYLYFAAVFIVDMVILRTLIYLL